MLSKWLSSSPSDRSLDVIRVVVAIILMIHPICRIANGDVYGFGTFLSASGFPQGVALAWFITLIQIPASLMMIIRRLLIAACFIHLFILVVGIFMDHIHHGWFVVGGGTEGMEYSVVLITCLFAIIWAHWPRKK